MLKEYKKPLAGTFRLLDILIILISSYVVYYFRLGPIGLNISALPIQYLMFFFTYVIVWIYLARRFKLYVSKRTTSFMLDAFAVSKTTALCLVIAMIPAFFNREYPLSRLFLLYVWPVQTGSLILFHFALRETLRYIRSRGYDYRQILIVGRNDRAAKIAKQIQDTPEFGLRVLGFIDAPDNENGDNPYNFKLIGNLDDFKKILMERVVDEVLVTLPMKSFYSEIEEIISLCEQVGTEVKIPTDLFSLSFTREAISRFGDIQVIDLYTSPKMNWQLMVKRLIDVVGVSVLLVLSFPLFVLVSALIKTTSKGPVFFKQQRVGYNGRLFTLMKFRTMVENAEELRKDLMALNEMGGPVFKIKNDPRTTKFGRFLRRTSIDELPQLINVLKGDMSFVGPRPPLPNEVSQYKTTDRRRLSIRPGITCIWQVSGRTAIPFEKWMELDRQYIDQWSLWLDFKILAKTIPAVLRGSGAA